MLMLQLVGRLEDVALQTHLINRLNGWVGVISWHKLQLTALYVMELGSTSILFM